MGPPPWELMRSSAPRMLKEGASAGGAKTPSGTVLSMAVPPLAEGHGEVAAPHGPERVGAPLTEGRAFAALYGEAGRGHGAPAETRGCLGGDLGGAQDAGTAKGGDRVVVVAVGGLGLAIAETEDLLALAGLSSCCHSSP